MLKRHDVRGLVVRSKCRSVAVLLAIVAIATIFRLNSTVPSDSGYETSCAPLPPPYVYRGGDLRNRSFAPKYAFSRAVWRAVRAAKRLSRTNDTATVIPLIITPLLMDVDVFKRMLVSVNVPVRHFYFIWNGQDATAGIVVDELRQIPFGVTVWHQPVNLGFSASINRGLRFGLKRREHFDWFFIVNSDVRFPKDTLEQFAKRVNAQVATDARKLPSHHGGGASRGVGMFYGPSVDHFAFAVSHRAVTVAGLMDENFYPAYFEDIDWRWRFRLAGFEELVLDLPVEHIKNFNMKKEYKLLTTGTPGSTDTPPRCHGAATNSPSAVQAARVYQRTRRYGNLGWSYGQMKWGRLNRSQIHDDVPPSGWRTPFGIPNFPLHLWVVDPEFIRCIQTGVGTFHSMSRKCWYNGYKVLAPHLPNGTWFPQCMKLPTKLPYEPR